MEFKAVAGSAGEVRGDCAVVGVYESRELSAAAAQIDKRTRQRLSAPVKRGDFSGKLGDTLLLDALPGMGSTRVLLVGLGSRKKYNAKSYRKAFGASIQSLSRTGVRHCVSWLAQEPAKDLTAYYAGRFAAEATAGALYRVPDLKTSKKPPVPALKRVTLGLGDGEARAEAVRGLDDGVGIAVGLQLTRDLANLPANICTPKYLAGAAQDLARRHRSIEVRVLDEAAVAKLKMGLFLSVARGSNEPPRLIVLQYRGAPAAKGKTAKDKNGQSETAPIALVGKGVTFDSGGISIKPSAAMDEMKFDMGGAASVLGTFAAAAALRLPINLVGVVPACENMPSGHATKPGDVFTSMSGQTVEVLNTDAEGRLILADALTYVREFKPAAVIDVATLTGACVVALGAHHSGLMSTDDALAAELGKAAERAGDGAWRLPLGEEYTEQLKSNFADMANVAGREGGAITAACFLSKFTEGLRWAHLDIAGTAWLGGDKKGSTGRPVPLLMDFLIEKTRLLERSRQ